MRPSSLIAGTVLRGKPIARSGEGARARSRSRVRSTRWSPRRRCRVEARPLDARHSLIDRVDELIQDGVIGGSERNAADFQIATSVSLLLTMEDVRPVTESRPAEQLARDVVPDQPGRMPSVFAT